MSIYYSDESVTLYHGRCEDVLPSLAPSSAHVLLTDPPYFEVKDDEWDNQWEHATEFLAWLGSVLDAAKPSLTPNASTWVFAGPALASQVEGVVRERFRVLNQIRWVKEQGWHQKAEIEAQRRYLAPWEAIVFAERSDGIYEQAVDELHKEVLAPVAGYIAAERARSGVDRRTIAVELAAAGVYRNVQTGAAMCSDWEHGDSLPTVEGYRVLKHVMGEGFLGLDHGELRARWDDLTREFYAARKPLEETLRRPFHLKRSGPVSDVWNFDTVAPYAGKHPCEKPQALLHHMIDVSSRPGDLILDPFAGSGSTLLAARDAGRRAIGIEMDRGYCDRIASRLAQGVLDFGEATA